MRVVQRATHLVILSTSLLFGVVATSSPSAPPSLDFKTVSTSETNDRLDQSGRVGLGIKLVKIDLAVMSRCPDARLCESLMDDVFAQPGIREKIDIKLRYIAEPDSHSPYGGTCKHGDVECQGNIHQLCVQHLLPSHHRSLHPPHPHRHNPQHPFHSRLPSSSRSDLNPIELTSLPPVWPFAQASNYDYARIGDDAYAKECADAVGIDWVGSGVEGCVNGSTRAEMHGYTGQERLSLGASLAYESATGLKEIGVGKSCTILIEDEVRCIHDGEWYDCDDGHERGDFVRSIEQAYKRLNKGH